MYASFRNSKHKNTNSHRRKIQTFFLEWNRLCLCTAAEVAVKQAATTEAVATVTRATATATKKVTAATTMTTAAEATAAAETTKAAAAKNPKQQLQ